MAQDFSINGEFERWIVPKVTKEATRNAQKGILGISGER